MAIVQNDYYEVSLTFIDETGSRSSLTAYRPATEAIAAVQTRAAALAAAVMDVTGCQLAGRSITLSAVEVDPGIIGGFGSRVERKAKLMFRTDKGKTTSISIPSPVGIITSDGRIDEDNAGVAAVITEIIGQGWCDTNARDIVSLSKAYESFINSTRPMLPSKKTPDADTDAET